MLNKFASICQLTTNHLLHAYLKKETHRITSVSSTFSWERETQRHDPGERPQKHGRTAIKIQLNWKYIAGMAFIKAHKTEDFPSVRLVIHPLCHLMHSISCSDTELSAKQNKDMSFTASSYRGQIVSWFRPGFSTPLHFYIIQYWE